MPLSASARVSGSSAAMWRYVKSTSPSRSREYSGSIGSLNLSTRSASPQASSTETILAPARSYCSSGNAPPSPALVSTRTSCPRWISSRAPAGVRATRYSSVLISLGTPIRKARRHYLAGPGRRSRHLGADPSQAHNRRMPRHAVRRRLATVLFVDIVGSTALASELGDARWRELLTRFRRIVRDELKRNGGREQDTAGDGFFATFGEPVRALACAAAIVIEVQQLGVDVRVGVHAGECEEIDGKLGGIAVHIGS